MDEDEIDRLLRELGLELPDVTNDAASNAEPPPLDDPDELGDWQW